MTSSQDNIVLDHVEGIVVSREMHHNNFNVLRSLEIGLFSLASFTRQKEIEALEIHGKDKIVGLVKADDEALMLGCVFDWFAISMVSYMSTVKLTHLMEENRWDLAQLQVKGSQNKLRVQRSSYIDRVAPELLQWRNKIAAHRAATDPRGDVLAVLTYSTMPTVTYHSPYYRVGDFTITMGDGSVSPFQPWALTQTYEKLALRYWPDRKLSDLDW